MALHGSTTEGVFMTELGFPIEIALSLEEDDSVGFGMDTVVKTNKDYNELLHKPSINGVTLEGNKTNEELGIPTRTSQLTNDSDFISGASLIFDCGSASEVLYGGI